MATRLAIVVASFAAGLALAALWLGRDPEPTAVAPIAADLGDELERLREQLAVERDARHVLEGEVAMLRIALGEPDGDSAPREQDPAADPVREAEGATPEPSPEADEGPLWSDEGALLAAGIEPAEATRLRERFEEYELARLFLRDRARREGWLRSPRFRSEQLALEEELREEIGDVDYDRMLWAAGRKNRVIVAGVLGRSEAEAAGLEPGDVIVSYAGARVYEIGGITRATAEGRAGEPTELRYRRGGEERRAYVPRGPLGVRLRSERGTPDTLR